MASQGHSVSKRRVMTRGGSFRVGQVEVVLKKSVFMIFPIPGSNNMC